MNTFKKMTFAVLALGAGLAVAPSLHAQDASSGSAAPKAPGMMDHGGMMGSGGMMGGDMGAMMKMMENCHRMMQSMNNQAPQNPSGATPPPPPGQRG